jgi:thiol-disulfide isomerase/thioredoxin
MKSICLFIIGILLTTKIYSRQKDADTGFPQTDLPCPSFILDNVEDYPQKKVTVDDFSGKWLILDFWDKHCGACISSFPGINARQKKYSSEIQYLLIGKEDENSGIKMIYEKFKQGLNLEISHTYDSLIFKKWGIGSCPLIIIIDPKGMVKGITTTLSDDNIANLIAGKPAQLQPAYWEHAKQQEQYDLNDIDDRYDSTLLFKSVLNRWNPAMKGSCASGIFPRHGKFETIADNINHLFMLAYIGQDGVGTKDPLYGQLFGRPVTALADPEKFDRLLKEGLYCYRLTFPGNKSSKQDIMQAMQNDLRNYFGYEAFIEEKMMPCWELTTNKTARRKLKTLGGTPVLQGKSDTGLVIKNYPVKKLIQRFVYLDIPVIDKTRIKDNIDLEISFIMTNFDSLQKGLNQNGLSLVKGSKRMKVLVIKDIMPGKQPMTMPAEAK